MTHTQHSSTAPAAVHAPPPGTPLAELLELRSSAVAKSVDLDDVFMSNAVRRADHSALVIDILAEVESARLAGALLRNRVEFSSFLVDSESVVQESAAVENELKGLSERLRNARRALSSLSREQESLIDDLRAVNAELSIIDARIAMGPYDEALDDSVLSAPPVLPADSYGLPAPLFDDVFGLGEEPGAVDLGQDDSTAPVTMDTYATEEDAR